MNITLTLHCTGFPRACQNMLHAEPAPHARDDLHQQAAEKGWHVVPAETIDGRRDTAAYCAACHDNILDWFQAQPHRSGDTP